MSINNFVTIIEEERRVGQRSSVERSADGFGRVIEVVLGWKD